MFPVLRSPTKCFRVPAEMSRSECVLQSALQNVENCLAFRGTHFLRAVPGSRFSAIWLYSNHR